MQKYYVAKNGEPHGPVTVNQVARLIEAGEICERTWVYDENSWMPLHDHPSFQIIFSPDGKADPSILDTRQRLEASVSSLKKEIGELETKRGEIENSLKQAEKRAADAESAQADKRSELEKALKDLEAKKAKFAAEEKELASKLNSARTELEEMSKKNAEIKSQREELEARRAELEKTVVGLEQDVAKKEQAGAEAAAEKLKAVEGRIQKLAEEEQNIENRSARRERELEQRTQRLSEAEDEILVLTRRKEALGSELDEAEKALASRRDEIESESLQKQELNDELRRLRGEVAGLSDVQKEVRELTEAKVRLEQERDVVQEELDRMLQQRSAVDTEATLIRGRLGDIRRETHELEEKRLEAQALLGNEVFDSFERIRQTMSGMEELASRLRDNESRDSEARDEERGLVREVLDGLKNRENDLLGVIGRLKEEMVFKEGIEAGRAKLEELNNDIEETIAELKDLTVKAWREAENLESYREKQNVVRDEMRVEQDRLASIRNETVSAEALLAERTAACEAAEQRRVAAEDAVARAETQRNELTSEIERFEATASARRESLSLFEARIAESKEKASAGEERRREIEREIEEARRQLESIRAEHLDFSEAVGLNRAAAAELESQKFRIESEIEALGSQKEIQLRSIEELKEIRNEILSSVTDLEGRLGVLRTGLDQKQEATEKFQQKLTEVQSEYNELNIELSRLKEEREAQLADLDARVKENEGLLEAALEARVETESELEERLAELDRVTSELDENRSALEKARNEREELEARRSELAGTTEKQEAELRRLTSDITRDEDRLSHVQTELTEKEERVASSRVKERELSYEIERLEGRAKSLSDEVSGIERRCVENRSAAEKAQEEFLRLEQERSRMAQANVKELRELLLAREREEKERLGRLITEYKTEFRQIQEDWNNEENFGVSSAELKKIRTDVEEKAREVTRAERQLTAMRAGLAKLREENGRTLMERITDVEEKELADLRRRLTESQEQISTLERDWSTEVNGAELVDRQWMEIKNQLEKTA